MTVDLEAMIARIVDERLAAREADDWVPHTKWPVQSVRVACALARAGEIDAHRAGRLWLARRSEIDRWVRSQPRTVSVPTSKASNDYNPVAMIKAGARGKRSA